MEQAAAAPRGVTDQSDMTEVQLKLNADLIKRIEALEEEKKSFVDQIKGLQAAVDVNRKNKLNSSKQNMIHHRP